MNKTFRMERSSRGIESATVWSDGDIVIDHVDGSLGLHMYDLIPVIDAWLDAVSSKTDGFGPCSKKDCDALECALERLVGQRGSSERSGTVSSNGTETDNEAL